jgi:hypothetical protein
MGNLLVSMNPWRIAHRASLIAFSVRGPYQTIEDLERRLSDLHIFDRSFEISTFENRSKFDRTNGKRTSRNVFRTHISLTDHCNFFQSFQVFRTLKNRSKLHYADRKRNSRYVFWTRILFTVFSTF